MFKKMIQSILGIVLFLGISQNIHAENGYGNVSEAIRIYGTIPEDDSIDDVIKILAKKGTLCRVLGHVWQPHRHTTLEYAPDRIDCRKCRDCETHQSLCITSTWK